MLVPCDGAMLALDKQAVRLYCCVLSKFLSVFDAVWGRNLTLIACKKKTTMVTFAPHLPSLNARKHVVLALDEQMVRWYCCVLAFEAVVGFECIMESWSHPHLLPQHTVMVVFGARFSPFNRVISQRTPRTWRVFWTYRPQKMRRTYRPQKMRRTYRPHKMRRMYRPHKMRKVSGNPESCEIRHKIKGSDHTVTSLFSDTRCTTLKWFSYAKPYISYTNKKCKE